MKVNLKSKNGFTLVELLAVIVILAIILAIAVPGISKLIKSATKNAFASDAKMILKSVEIKSLEDESFNPLELNESNIKDKLNIDNSKYQSLTIKRINNQHFIAIVGTDKWKDLVACGTKTSLKILDVEDLDLCEVVGNIKVGNQPVLAEGMTPIKWNGTTEVTTTETDPDWYNYNTKNWANAKTADGSYWVWIPRYIYKISSGWHSSTAGTINVQFSKGTNDNWNSSSIGNIDTGTTANASNNKWTNHPAFTFGDTELTGFWVAKFEASGTTSAIKSVPNVTSLSPINTSDMFDASRNMETNAMYGWGDSGKDIDTHMMKNSEWGAIAYLSKSQYGKETEEIWINNNSQYITGCAGNSVSASSFDGCQNAYHTPTGVNASSTGNIYGIYDLSGGAGDRVAAYVDNGHANLRNQGLSIINAASKYKDVYKVGADGTQASFYALFANHKGDAMYETSASHNGSTSWYGDYSDTPYAIYPWFERGGSCHLGSLAGAFSFFYNNGYPARYVGFRAILAVGAGL